MRGYATRFNQALSKQSFSNHSLPKNHALTNIGA